MHGIAEKVQAKLDKSRTTALKLVRSMVVAAANGQEKVSDEKAEELAEALTTLGYSPPDLAQWIGDYRSYIDSKKLTELHPEIEARNREAIRQADECRDKIAELVKKEVDLRDFPRHTDGVIVAQRQALESAEKATRWIREGDVPPPKPIGVATSDPPACW
jgi:hypothetical protein